MGHEPNAVWSAAMSKPDRSELLIVARSMVVARKALHETLPSSILQDVALDLLLSLYIADEPQPVTSLARSTTTVVNVAVRWIEALVKMKLVMVQYDTASLSDDGLAKMTATLRNVAQSQWQLSHNV